jgi:DNA-binding IclR family transcriptional regulator
MSSRARPALAASRAVEVLNFLAASPGQAFSLSELVEHVGLNIASCHAVLNVLTRGGYLERHPKHKTYRLGPALVAIGHAALESHPAIDVARDEARELAQKLGLEVLVTARIGDELIAIARAGRYASPNASLRVGQRLPLWPPWGAPFMAWAPAADVEAWLARGPQGTPAQRPHHLEMLELVRQRGYAASLSSPLLERLGEVVAHLSASPHATGLHDDMTRLVGELSQARYQLAGAEGDERFPISLLSAPVFNAHGHVAYTLGLLGFPGPLTLSEIETYAAQLKAACLHVTRQSNGRLPDGQG